MIDGQFDRPTFLSQRSAKFATWHHRRMWTIHKIHLTAMHFVAEEKESKRDKKQKEKNCGVTWAVRSWKVEPSCQVRNTVVKAQGKSLTCPQAAKHTTASITKAGYTRQLPRGRCCQILLSKRLLSVKGNTSPCYLRQGRDGKMVKLCCQNDGCLRNTDAGLQGSTRTKSKRIFVFWKPSALICCHQVANIRKEIH